MSVSIYEELRQIVGTTLDSPGMGGNISIKTVNGMIIKSSGQDMKKVHKTTLVDFDSRVTGDKPSMEWEMHQLIPSKYVVHYHPVYVMPCLCAKNPSKYLIYGDVVKYVTPGKPLADELRELQKVKKLDNIIFLLNHGVVIHADTIEEIKDLYNKIKRDFFIQNDRVFTPDDAVDPTSSDLYLFRAYMLLIAQKFDIELLELNDTQISDLKSSTDEQYRQSQLQKK